MSEAGAPWVFGMFLFSFSLWGIFILSSFRGSRISFWRTAIYPCVYSGDGRGVGFPIYRCQKGLFLLTDWDNQREHQGLT